MNISKSIACAGLLALIVANAATAAPAGTAKARGDFRPFAQTSYAATHHARHRQVVHSPMRTTAASVHYAAPMAVTHHHAAAAQSGNHWALLKADPQKYTSL
jgi:hypothetical protein